MDVHSMAMAVHWPKRDRLARLDALDACGHCIWPTSIRLIAQENSTRLLRAQAAGARPARGEGRRGAPGEGTRVPYYTTGGSARARRLRTRGRVAVAKDEGPKVVRWDDVPREQMSELLARQFITGERITLAHIYLDKGCVVPMHAHENEQLSYILKGELRFRIGSEDAEPVIVKAGEVLVTPPNVPHSAEAVEDTLSLDVFSPPRQDWLSGDDAYLRK